MLAMIPICCIFFEKGRPFSHRNMLHVVEAMQVPSSFQGVPPPRGLQGVQQTIRLLSCISVTASGCSWGQGEELGSNKLPVKTYIALCIHYLSYHPSFCYCCFFFCLQQGCGHDLNMMCIVTLKQGCASPSENVLFGTFTSKEAKCWL